MKKNSDDSLNDGTNLKRTETVQDRKWREIKLKLKTQGLESLKLERDKMQKLKPLYV